MSIWNLMEKREDMKVLDRDIDVDVLIIGAGMTGLTTAYNLRDLKDVVVVEASILGHGVTLNTTAKINYLQETIYTKIIASRGKDFAIKYLQSQRDAIDNIKSIIETERINCDFKQVSSHIFADVENEIEKLEKEVAFLRNQGIDIRMKVLPSKITSYASYAVDDTYVFNPYKYLKEIYSILKRKKIPVYENTRIVKIEKIGDKYICYTPNNKITCKKVVLATHYPYFNIPLFLPIKSTVEKSYIIVSRVARDGEFTAINTTTPTYSCRFYSDGENTFQISLAESHNAAFKQNDEYHFRRVQEIFGLKDSDIVLRYSNTDMMTPDHMPYIGKIQDNMYMGCGYNTWGMTNGVLASKIISDEIRGIANEYSRIFSPRRITLANIVNLPHIIFCQTKSFLGSKLLKRKSWYDRVYFYNENGISYAVYIDDKGLEHHIKNKCPHLGCSLIFNEVEHVWDCPCHSSRFNLDGKCIKGPSNYDISKERK